jgi:hypothetical protein
MQSSPNSRFVLPDARVHTEYDAEAFGRSLLYDCRPHPVSIAQALRDEGLNLSTKPPQRRQQDHHRHGPVHVVVTVNQNFLSLLQSTTQARHGWLHVCQQEGVVKLIESGIQKSLG